MSVKTQAVVFGAAALLGWALVVLLAASLEGAEAPRLLPPPGTVFATRNAGGEDTNRSPGYWNHIAVMGPNGWVIEAQREHDGVVAVPWRTFYTRYPRVLALQVTDQGGKLAAACVAQLGQPYRLVRDNCVDLLTDAMLAVHQKRPPWQRPDHVVRNARATLWHKYDPGWSPPADPWRGMTKDPTDLQRMVP